MNIKYKGTFEDHRECQQDSEYGTRSANGHEIIQELAFADNLGSIQVYHVLASEDHIPQIKEPYHLLYQTGAYTRHEVKNQETFGAYVLQYPAEHINGEHIKKHMRKRMGIVHEHIRNDLISLEVGSTRDVKP